MQFDPQIKNEDCQILLLPNLFRDRHESYLNNLLNHVVT